MSRPTDPRTSPDTIPEHDLRAILDRAIKLDVARDKSLTFVEVERIGEELGISSAAMRSALAELRAEEEAHGHRRARWRTRLRGWFGSLTMGLTAFAGGWLVGGKDETVNFVLFLATAMIALYYRDAGRVGRYFRDMAVAWLGFGAGWFFASGMVDTGDTGFHLVVPGIAGMALGAILMKMRWPFTSRDRGDGTAHQTSDE